MLYPGAEIIQNRAVIFSEVLKSLVLDSHLNLVMNINYIKTLLFSLALSVVAPISASACPDIDGLVDVNCDRLLTIVCFGDSITFGRSDKPIEVGYPGRLNNFLPNALVYNLGRPGEKTTEGLFRAGREFSSIPNIDYIIVLEGTNDYYITEWSASRTRSNLLDIIQRGQNRGALTILASLTDIKRTDQKPWIRSVNNAITNFVLIDFFSLGDGIISEDSIHPGPEGYSAMTALVVQQLPLISENNRPADTDSDGIYDFAESFFGTDIFNADSDNDSILDGREVFEFGSNPLALDSDGDGFTDAEEINEIGSNPADPRPGAPQISNVEVMLPET